MRRIRQILAALAAVLMLLPAVSFARKSGTTSFEGVAGESYDDVYGTYSGALEDPEVSVSGVKGGCISKVSAYTKTTSGGQLALHMKYTCVKAGTATLKYHFDYSYGGKNFSYVWDTTVTVLPEEEEEELILVDDDDDDEPEPFEGKPVVTKDPTSENVEEDGTCSFVARADGADEIVWYVTDGEVTIKASRLKNQFDGIKVTGADEEKVKLSHIPAELDGWKIYARFINDEGHTNSKRATIRVEADPTPAPTAAPTPTPVPTPVPTPTHTPVPTPTPHAHMYSAAYTGDANGHWHECACGEHTGTEAHVFTWQTLYAATRNKPGSELGVCSLCGYSVEREVAFEGADPLLTAVIVLAVLLVGALSAVAVLLYKRR